MATDKPISQENSKGEIIDQNANQSQKNSKNNITAPGIVNIFQSTISPREISFDFPALEETKKELANGFGLSN